MRLKESNKEIEKTLDNKKTKSKQIKKISKSEEENIQFKIEENEESSDESTNNKDENGLTDELNNARKKRRRSSASIE